MGVLDAGDGTTKGPGFGYLDCLVRVIDLLVIAEEEFKLNKFESTPTNLLLTNPLLFKKLGKLSFCHCSLRTWEEISILI